MVGCDGTSAPRYLPCAVLGLRPRGQPGWWISARLIWQWNQRWPTGDHMAEDSTNFLKGDGPHLYDGVGFDYKWGIWGRNGIRYFATPFGGACLTHYHKILLQYAVLLQRAVLLAGATTRSSTAKRPSFYKLWGTYAEKCSRAAHPLFLYVYPPGKKLNFMECRYAHFREWD